MLYSSLLFIYGFLPLSLLIYIITPESLKKTVLFILSMIFCALNSLKFLEFMINENEKTKEEKGIKKLIKKIF